MPRFKASVPGLFKDRGGAISLQPKAEKLKPWSGSDTSKVLTQADWDTLLPEHVNEWSTLDVQQQFLNRIGKQDTDDPETPGPMAKYGRTFMEHKIEGRVLLGLTGRTTPEMVDARAPKLDGLSEWTEADVALRDLDVHALGDRRTIMNALKGLYGNRNLASEKEIFWFGEQPPKGAGCQYYSGPLEACQHTICPCLSDLAQFRMNGTGLDVQTYPPGLFKCFRDVRNNNYNWRFLKAVDRFYEPVFCCFCKQHHIRLLFDGEDKIIVDIRHPDMSAGRKPFDIYSRILATWDSVKLVASSAGGSG